MKKFLMCFAVFTAMVLMIGCGGSDDNSSGGSSSTSVCSYGEYECRGNDSYFCGYSGDDLIWQHSESCESGCNYAIGKCWVTIDGKTWSEISPSLMTLEEAETYCNNLTEYGYSDWRLPTISELRTLIQNCPATQTGGECGITDSCLSDDCSNDACHGCDLDSDGKYSKLGDNLQVILWSSSNQSDNTVAWWCVSFDRGSVENWHKANKRNVRCVR